jgi:hypothetical protein
MWPSRRRNEVIKLFGRRLLLVAVFLIAIALFSAVWDIARKARESAALKQQAELQLADLEARAGQLSSDIESLKTDRGKEEALRQQYALASKGEHMIVIVDPEPVSTIVASSSVMERIVHFFVFW